MTISRLRSCPNEAAQPEQQRRGQTEVGSRDDEPHPPEPVPEPLPVRMPANDANGSGYRRPRARTALRRLGPRARLPASDPGRVERGSPRPAPSSSPSLSTLRRRCRHPGENAGETVARCSSCPNRGFAPLVGRPSARMRGDRRGRRRGNAAGTRTTVVGAAHVSRSRLRFVDRSRTIRLPSGGRSLVCSRRWCASRLGRAVSADRLRPRVHADSGARTRRCCGRGRRRGTSLPHRSSRSRTRRRREVRSSPTSSTSRRTSAFVITRLLALNARAGGLLDGEIDPARIAVAGHSDGAVAALAVADDRRFRDSRIDAAIVMSGATLPGMGPFPREPAAPGGAGDRRPDQLTCQHGGVVRTRRSAEVPPVAPRRLASSAVYRRAAAASHRRARDDCVPRSVPEGTPRAPHSTTSRNTPG